MKSNVYPQDSTKPYKKKELRHRGQLRKKQLSKKQYPSSKFFSTAFFHNNLLHELVPFCDNSKRAYTALCSTTQAVLAGLIKSSYALYQF